MRPLRTGMLAPWLWGLALAHPGVGYPGLRAYVLFAVPLVTHSLRTIARTSYDIDLHTRQLAAECRRTIFFGGGVTIAVMLFASRFSASAFSSRYWCRS